MSGKMKANTTRMKGIRIKKTHEMQMRLSKEMYETTLVSTGMRIVRIRRFSAYLLALAYV
jgi:hypothetical protein